MKRICCLWVALLFVVTNALAEIDYSSMTADELLSVISQARATFMSLEPESDPDLIYSKDGLSVLINSCEENPEDDGYGGFTQIQINLLIKNASDKSCTFFLTDVAINGWTVDNNCFITCKPNTSTKNETIRIGRIFELSDISSLTDVESLELYGTVIYDDDEYHNFHTVLKYVDGEAIVLSCDYLD